MIVKNIVRAWRDPMFRTTLGAEELAQVPANPAGMIELDGTALDLVAGASGATGSGGTGTGHGTSASHASHVSHSTASTGSASASDGQGGGYLPIDLPPIGVGGL
jgi:mersacidin/lichenicidin family type 2 lantibiotic